MSPSRSSPPSRFSPRSRKESSRKKYWILATCLLLLLLGGLFLWLNRNEDLATTDPADSKPESSPASKSEEPTQATRKPAETDFAKNNPTSASSSKSPIIQGALTVSASGDTFNSLHKKAGGFIASMAGDSEGNVWFGTEDNGLFRYNPTSLEWKQFATPDGLDDNAYAIAVDRQGRVWLGHLNHGVSVFNGKEWKNYDVIDGPIGERVFDISVCPTDGDVWIATSAGLTRYSETKDTWRHYTRMNGLPEDQASAIAFDPEGNIFVGTQSHGLAMARAEDNYKKWRVVTGPGPNDLPVTPTGSGLPSYLINDVLIARDGTIYVATCAGLAISKDYAKSWTYVRGKDYADKVRRRRGGAPAGWKEAPKKLREKLLPEDYVTCLAQDDTGRLWLGFRRSGYLVIDLKTKKRTHSRRNRSDYVFAIIPSSTTSAMIGRYGGGIRIEHRGKPPPSEDEIKEFRQYEPAGKTINLLALTDPQKNIIKGKWQFDGKTLVSPKTPYARLKIPYAPPEEYVLEIEAVRTKGRNDLAIGLIAGGSQFLVGLDAMGPGDTSGLHLLDGRGINSNETSRKGRTFTNGKSCSIECTIRKQGIAVNCDGKNVIYWKGNFSRLSLKKNPWAVPDKKSLFIGAWDSIFRISKMKLTPIESKSFTTKTEQAGLTASSSSNNTKDSFPKLPTPAGPPTLAEIKKMQQEVKDLLASTPKTNTQPAPVAFVLADDWKTQGDFYGDSKYHNYRYGESYTKLCAHSSPFDALWGRDAIDFICTGWIGKNAKSDDALRHWVHWKNTDNVRTLKNPFQGGRRQSEWDDHGEAYSITHEGPHVYANIKVPHGTYYLSFYNFNKDGHTGNNRFRDYLITIKPYCRSEEEFISAKEFARSRMMKFWGGVYKIFVVTGPASYTVQLHDNWSFNTILAGVFIDPIVYTEEHRRLNSDVDRVRYNLNTIEPQILFAPAEKDGLNASAQALKLLGMFEQLRSTRPLFFTVRSRTDALSILRALQEDPLPNVPRQLVKRVQAECLNVARLFEWRDTVYSQLSGPARVEKDAQVP